MGPRTCQPRGWIVRPPKSKFFKTEQTPLGLGKGKGRGKDTGVGEGTDEGENTAVDEGKGKGNNTAVDRIAERGTVRYENVSLVGRLPIETFQWLRDYRRENQ